MTRAERNAMLRDDRDYLFQERAAILEYDAGYSRKEAEALARAEVARMVTK